MRGVPAIPAPAPVGLPALLFVAALLAGCSDGSSGDAPLGPEVPDPFIPTAYSLVCPPGGVEEGAVCKGRIESLTESNQEPFAAVDPWRPGVMAIGVNAGHTAEGLVVGDGDPSMDMVRLDIFVTEDNGTTWTRRQLPPIPAPDSTLEPIQSTVVGDPALVFSPDGVLHVSGIVTHSQVNGYTVFYIASPDLGASWNPPVLLSTDTDNDRNWMNRGPDGALYVPWQRVGSLSEVAWSLDNGATWNVQERSQVAQDCITVSEVVFWEGTPVLACANTSNATYTVDVLAFDPATGSLALRARLGMDCVWPKLTVAGDVLLLTGEGCPGVRYATSRDGGQSWSEPASIAQLAGHEAGGVAWQASDPWGRLHLMLLGDTLTYTVLDGEEVLLDAVLDASGAATVPEAPRTLAPAYGDHYYGIALAQWGGLLAWTEDSTIRYTLVAVS